MRKPDSVIEPTAAVAGMAARLDLEARLAVYSSHAWRGPPGQSPAPYQPDATCWPVLHLEDVSGIPFVSLVPGVEEYQHRARVRAADGDLFVAATPPAVGFEDYCRDTLGLGAPEFVLAEPGEHGPGK